MIGFGGVVLVYSCKKYKDDGVRWGELPRLINLVKVAFHNVAKEF